jgi:hypothetical protein
VKWRNQRVREQIFFLLFFFFNFKKTKTNNANGDSFSRKINFTNTTRIVFQKIGYGKNSAVFIRDVDGEKDNVSFL